MKLLMPLDRVAVYTEEGTMTGTVLSRPCDPQGTVYVELNTGHPENEKRWFHRKQLRKLTKKARRRIWVHENATKEPQITKDGWLVCLSAPLVGPWIEFIEVKK